MIERIIKFLKETDGYVSGEDISNVLNISRAAVWKYIDQLRSQGYEISAVPHLGYHLTHVPDKLFAHEISYDLKTRIIGKEIRAFDILSSTMDEAFSLASQDGQQGLVVCAESQTKGRGRMGRVWVSPKAKGIYASVILKPKINLNALAPITLLTALAISEAIEENAACRAFIKWPNDVYVNTKKIAGILTEMRAESDDVKFVIIGFGININASRSELLESATSLKIETGKAYARIKVFQDILRRLDFWYGIFLEQGSVAIINHCKKRSMTIGKLIKIEGHKGIVQGTAVDFDAQGALVVKTKEGKLIKHYAGDIVQA